MSDEHSYFSYSIAFLYGDSVGGYIKQFFYSIIGYLKENPYYYTYNILFFSVSYCPNVPT